MSHISPGPCVGVWVRSWTSMLHRIRFENSTLKLPLVTNLLTIRDRQHPRSSSSITSLLFLLFVVFPSSIIPTRMCRTCSAVNTLYIFMFWEVLLDLCVDRVTSLVQETLFFFYSSAAGGTSVSFFTSVSLRSAVNPFHPLTGCEMRLPEAWDRNFKKNWHFFFFYCELMQLIVRYDEIYCIEMFFKIKTRSPQEIFFRFW